MQELRVLEHGGARLMAGFGLSAILLIFVLMAFSGVLEGVDHRKVEILRMADKSRQNARKRPLKRSRKYAMIWTAKKRQTVDACMM